MTLFVWSKDYELGIEVIDQQHKRIVDDINRLYLVTSNEVNTDNIGVILNDLVDYTFSHLAFEEAMLEEIGYEDLREHQLTHSSFGKVIRGLQQRFINGEKVDEELASFLQHWLIAHIQTEDARYVDDVREKLLAVDPVQHKNWVQQTVSKYFQ